MKPERRYDIDWIRVIVFDILIIYHIGMFFVPWDWEIKNNELEEWITWPMIFVNRWRLSILFVVSGIGTSFALSQKSPGQFILERLKRLFLPLVFGILLVIAPQIYFVRLSEGTDYSSYLSFYPDFFKGIYPEGNFSWGHLWFLPYLIVITLLSIPVLIRLRKEGNILIQWLRKLVNKYPLALFVFVLPLFMVEFYLEPYYPINYSLWGDWYALSHYFLCFLIGFVLICLKDDFWRVVSKTKNIALITGLVSFPILIWMWDNYPNIFWVPLFASLNRWSWIIVIFGYSSRFLNKESQVIKYRNQAVYPFYILHQTITIAIGFYLMNSPMGNHWKLLILVIGTYAGCWLIYHFIILKVKPLKPLFGLRTKNRY